MMNDSNSQGRLHFGSTPSYKDKAKAMGLTRLNILKKDEPDNDIQIVKVDSVFLVANEADLEKGIILTNNWSKTQTESANNSVADPNIYNDSSDRSMMSLGNPFNIEGCGPQSQWNNYDHQGNPKPGRNQNSLEEKKSEKGYKNEVKLEDLKYVEDLGSSSQGDIKKMVHKPTNTPIALKIVDLHTDDNFLKALRTEISTLQDCNSEYVVRCYGAYLTGGSISIALEFMDKGSLADILKKVGVISEPILGMITYQVLKGLEYLHKTMKVIHRDIKPSNLLLNSEGQVKIADFGVSGKNDFGCKVRWVGILPYISPERCRGEKYNFDSDLWSLGLIILECALGRYPYAEPGSDTPKLTFFDFVDILSTKSVPTPPDNYSDAFKDFISICLRKEPSTRSTASELLKHNFVKKFADVDRCKFGGWLSTV